jgi:hypothetical protein
MDNPDLVTSLTEAKAFFAGLNPDEEMSFTQLSETLGTLQEALAVVRRAHDAHPENIASQIFRLFSANWISTGLLIYDVKDASLTFEALDKDGLPAEIDPQAYRDHTYPAGGFVPHVFFIMKAERYPYLVTITNTAGQKATRLLEKQG